MTDDSPPSPARGQVWWVSFSPTRGHEQAGRRPALVLSSDLYNYGPASLVVVAPLTSKNRPIPLWVRVDPPEAGLSAESSVMTDAVRSVSKERFGDKLGAVEESTLRTVEDRLRTLLEL